MSHRSTVGGSRIGGNADTGEGGVRRRGVVDDSRELERRVERKIEQLLESQVGHFAVALSLNHDRPLIRARYLGAQQLELRDVADSARQPRLAQHVLCLNRGRFGQCNQSVCERCVKVRLRHIEPQLRALRRELDVGGTTPGIGDRVLRDDTSTREQALRKCETQVVLVLGAEAETAKRGERVGAEGAARRILETGQTLRGRRRRITQVLIARCRWRGGFRSRIRRRSSADAGKLRRKGADIAGRAADLGKELTAGLPLLAMGPIDAGASDADRLALRFRDADGLIKREGARNASANRQRWRGWRNHLRCEEGRCESRQGRQEHETRDGRLNQAAVSTDPAQRFSRRHCSGRKLFRSSGLLIRRFTRSDFDAQGAKEQLGIHMSGLVRRRIDVWHHSATHCVGENRPHKHRSRCCRVEFLGDEPLSLQSRQVAT